MKRHHLHHRSFALLALAGSAATAAHASDPTALYPTLGTVSGTGHIYYNAVTGERVVTLLGDGQTAPADVGDSELLWSTAGGYPQCIRDEIPVTSFFFGIADPNGTTALSQATELLQTGEMHKDTVVDCISITWVVGIPDEDLDSDGTVDGVEELALQWVIYDADDGRSVDRSTRLPLVDVLFFNLPGNTPENQSAGALTGWTADVDLVGFGTATDLSFEIGDSDGDCQSAGFCNNDVDTNSDGFGDGVSISNADRNFDGLPDSDLDGDGLFDWSWSVQVYLPGTGNDFDSDSDTGDFPQDDADTIGIPLGWPVGLDVDPVGGPSFDPDVPGAALGYTNRFAVPDGAGGYDNFFFGDFACPNGSGMYVPPSVFQFVLYTPGTVGLCNGDFNGDGVLNFFDISIFLPCYNSGGGIDCVDPDLNGDGEINFFDISLLLQWFNEGCGSVGLP
jgi:hypothetical protein